jgi:hypothetical protein
MRRFFLLVIAVASTTTASCSAIVLHDAAATAPCASSDDCPSATSCTDGACADAVSDGVPDARVLIGVDGGVLLGVDGVTIEFPPGALPSSLPLEITRASVTLEYENFTPSGRLYRVAPSTELAAAARVAIPGATGTLFVRPATASATWDAVNADADGRFAIARLTVFGAGDAVEAP